MLGLGWLLCLGATVGCAVAVLTFSEVMIQVSRGADVPGLRPHGAHDSHASPCFLCGWD